MRVNNHHCFLFQEVVVVVVVFPIVEVSIKISYSNNFFTHFSPIKGRGGDYQDRNNFDRNSGGDRGYGYNSDRGRGGDRGRGYNNDRGRGGGRGGYQNRDEQGYSGNFRERGDRDGSRGTMN